jgi:hypothetical protein
MIENLPSVVSAGTELAVPAVALDDLADLVRLEGLLRKHIDESQAELDDVQRRIKERMGESESATIDGGEIFTWRRIDGVNETKLKKAYPQIAAAYTDLVEKPVLNKDLLREAKPDIFREFQTRQFKRVG